MGLSNESISDNDQAAEEKETMTFMVTMPMHKYLAALALVKRRQTNLNVVTEEAFDTDKAMTMASDTPREINPIRIYILFTETHLNFYIWQTLTLPRYSLFMIKS